MKHATEHHPQALGPTPDPRIGSLRRWLPALALLLLIVAGYALGLHRQLSLTTLAENRDVLSNWVDAHMVLALAGYVLLYFAVVALSLPAAGIMSIAGGFLFGWAISAPASVIAAVAGAAAVFHIVKTSFGAALAERAGPMLQRVSQGFAENAFSLLLFLRLMPVFPFWAVNALAGLSRIPMRTFLAATAIGIIPASLAFALVGSGLDQVIDAQLASYQACVAAKGAAECRFSIDVSALLTPQLTLGLAALALVALIPLGVRLLKGHRA